MSFRQNVENVIGVLKMDIKYLYAEVYALRNVNKDISLLQTEFARMNRDCIKVFSKVNESTNQITDLKQEICGLKTGMRHQFEYKGDVGPQHMFVCKLCGYLVLKTETELTPVERKALQTLGILKNESKKCSDK